MTMKQEHAKKRMFATGTIDVKLEVIPHEASRYDVLWNINSAGVNVYSSGAETTGIPLGRDHGRKVNAPPKGRGIIADCMCRNEFSFYPDWGKAKKNRPEHWARPVFH